MPIFKKPAFRALFCGFALTLLGAAPHGVTGTPAHAFSTQPSTPIPAKCRKYANDPTKLRRCVRAQSSQLRADDLYTIGYWQAQRGDYSGAIETLKQVESSGDPRILTYIGFATRKLGDVQTAMEYYNRALSIDPGFVAARAYMGEGFLQKGDLASAESQLEEIAERCGAGCEEYASLEEAIKLYKAKAS